MSGRGRAAFTLVELLVVIAIIALLVSILLPMLQGAIQQARLAVCITNHRSVHTASFSYAASEDGVLPGPASAHTAERRSMIAYAAYGWSGQWVDCYGGDLWAVNVGPTYLLGYASDWRIFYCPQCQTQELYSFANQEEYTKLNPAVYARRHKWIDFTQTSAAATTHTTFHYNPYLVPSGIDHDGDSYTPRIDPKTGGVPNDAVYPTDELFPPDRLITFDYWEGWAWHDDRWPAAFGDGHVEGNKNPQAGDLARQYGYKTSDASIMSLRLRLVRDAINGDYVPGSPPLYP